MDMGYGFLCSSLRFVYPISGVHMEPANNSLGTRRQILFVRCVHATSLIKPHGEVGRAVAGEQSRRPTATPDHRDGLTDGDPPGLT
jgi:hypothetical protein